ncbi:MAG: YcxB family protein [Wujia sp.]
MAVTNKKSVNMTYRALYSYILNTNYRSFSGITGLFLSVAALVILAIGWDKMGTSQRLIFMVVGLVFLVINPLMLAFKAFKQFKLSPSYRKPLDYLFEDDGITVSQGELKQELSWDKICRLMLTNSMLAIYTSRVHAFVIPISELGEEKGKIITMLVQFTAEYKPMLSGNLKEYRSGKGYTGM